MLNDFSAVFVQNELNNPRHLVGAHFPSTRAGTMSMIPQHQTKPPRHTLYPGVILQSSDRRLTVIAKPTPSPLIYKSFAGLHKETSRYNWIHKKVSVALYKAAALGRPKCSK